MGGKKELRVFLSESDDIVDSLLSTAEGGRRLQRGLREVIRDKYQGAFDVVIVRETCPRPDLPPPDSKLFSRSVDVAVFSAQPAVAGLKDAQEFQQTLLNLVRTVKQRANAYILVYNCCSVDPSDQTHTYYGRPDTLSLRTHKFNLARKK